MLRPLLDDTTLLAGTKEDLTELVERVRRASEKAGLYLNVGKTKVMTTGDIGEMTVDGIDVEVVTKFVFLGALITKDGLCEKEVRRRIAMGKAAMGGLTSIWKDRGVMMETKVKLVKVLVYPIVLYGAETWTMRKHERRKIDAFEFWCWRRVLRVKKRMAVNGMVKRLCKEEEVGYVDLWDSFVGKEEMYMREGLHLSGKGAAVFAEGLSGAVASGLGKVRYLN